VLLSLQFPPAKNGLAKQLSASRIDHHVQRPGMSVPHALCPLSKADSIYNSLLFAGDYLNPIDLCNKLNTVRALARFGICPQPCTAYLHRGTDSQFVLPEMVAHAFLTTLFMLGFQVISFLINAPLVAYNVNKCVCSADLFFPHRCIKNAFLRVLKGQHLYDATEVSVKILQVAFSVIFT
jgi:hypothetical protein